MNRDQIILKNALDEFKEADFALMSGNVGTAREHIQKAAKRIYCHLKDSGVEVELG